MTHRGFIFCRIGAILVSHFILDLRAAYLADDSSSSSPSQMTSLQFAVGNLGAALKSYNGASACDDEYSIPLSDNVLPSSHSSIHVYEDPFVEYLVVESSTIQGKVEGVGGDDRVYMCDEDGELYFIDGVLEQ